MKNFQNISREMAEQIILKYFMEEEETKSFEAKKKKENKI